MGRKVSDGKAFDAAAPNGQVINDYDLYRINGWNGVAIGSKTASQTDRTLAFECDPAAIYSILVPDGVEPEVGSFLYWDVNDDTTFQRGDTDLDDSPAAGQMPCFHVLTEVNANGEVQGRILQSGTQGVGDVTAQSKPDAIGNTSGSVAGVAIIDIRTDTEAHQSADAEANDATLAQAINDLYDLLEDAGVLT